jgi:glutathione S-transferase
MSAIKLYGVGASRVFRNIWMLNELGLQFEHDPIHYTDPKLKEPPYSTMNPNARIPMLSIDGFVMFESLAINLYLAQRFTGPLTPASTEALGHAIQHSLWAATEIEQPIMDWAVHTLLKPEAERDTALAQSALAKLQRPLQALEQYLSQSSYLLGNTFTVADLNVAAVMYRCLWMPMVAMPKTNQWLKLCLERPAALTARRARGEAI